MLSSREIDDTFDSFSNTVNFWYPVSTTHQLSHLKSTLVNGAPNENEDIDFCLAALTMALGLAGEVTAGLADGHTESKDQRERRASRKALADAYFDGVMRRLHVVHGHVGSKATQCLFFMAYVPFWSDQKREGSH